MCLLKKEGLHSRKHRQQEGRKERKERQEKEGDKIPCGKTYTKVMAKVRRKYPRLSLKRRKKIASAIVYRKKKKKR